MDRDAARAIARSWMIPTESSSYMCGLEDQPILAASSGVNVTDTDGRTYLDFQSGQMGAALGHQHPRMVARISSTMQSMLRATNTMLNLARLRLHEKLGKLLPPPLARSLAARAIRDGDADVIAVLAADVFDVAAHNEMLDRFNGSMRDWMAPQGFGGANGTFALHTRLYMERFGATARDFGALPVAQRFNAQGNPNALFKTPMSMDDYLSARMIGEPLRLFDCVLPCVGGDCVILASETVARTLCGPKLRILGGGEMHNFPTEDIYALRAGWEDIAPRMYAQAGIGPRDLHFAQLYDDYPVMEFLQLEGLGIAPFGASPSFLHDHDTRYCGDFPINTGGGQLSAGQAGASGGMIGVVEAALQLRGEGGARQAVCTRGVVSGYGMVAYGRGLSCSAVILERVP